MCAVTELGSSGGGAGAGSRVAHGRGDPSLGRRRVRAAGSEREGGSAARGRPASCPRSRPFPSGPRRPARPVPHDTASAANFFLPILPRLARNGKWRPRRGVSCPTRGGDGPGGAMTRWVPTKREEKYGVGEQRADLAPGPAPPQLPRGAALPGGGTRRGAGGMHGGCGWRGRGDSGPPACPPASCPHPAPRPERTPVARHCPSDRGHALSPRPRASLGEPGRGHAGTRGVRSCHFPGGPSDIHVCGGWPSGGAFQPPGLLLTRRSCSFSGPGRAARVIVVSPLSAF